MKKQTGLRYAEMHKANAIINTLKTQVSQLKTELAKEKQRADKATSATKDAAQRMSIVEQKGKEAENKVTEAETQFSEGLVELKDAADKEFQTATTKARKALKEKQGLQAKLRIALRKATKAQGDTTEHSCSTPQSTRSTFVPSTVVVVSRPYYPTLSGLSLMFR